MLVSELIERCKSEYLHAGNVQIPSWDVQEGALTIGGVTLTLEGRADNVPDDGVLEFYDSSMELALVKDAVGNVVTLQERGFLETTAAAHVDGTRVVLDPPYPRQVIFNALKSVLSSLYAYGVYDREFHESTYNAITPITLPAVATEPLSVIWVSRGTGLGWNKLIRGAHWEPIHLSDGIRVQFYHGGSQGRTVQIPYKRAYQEPTALTDDLDNFGVSTTLQPHLPLGIAGQLLLGREVPKLHAEHIKRQLEGQNVPVGSLANIGRLLWQTFIQQHVQAERSRLSEITPPVILTGG